MGLKVNHTNALYASPSSKVHTRRRIGLTTEHDSTCTNIPCPSERITFCRVLVSAEIFKLLQQFTSSRVASTELGLLRAYFQCLKESHRYLETGGLKFCIALPKCQLVGVQLILVPAVAKRNVFKSNKITKKKNRRKARRARNV